MLRLYKYPCPPIPPGANLPRPPKLVAVGDSPSILLADVVVELPGGFKGTIYVYVREKGTIGVEVEEDKCIYVVAP